MWRNQQGEREERERERERERELFVRALVGTDRGSLREER